MSQTKIMDAARHHDLISDILDSKLSIGDQIQFTVVSNSMAPLLQVGDSIIATLAKPDAVQRGDIIVIRRDGDFLTHRAIKPIEGGWLTKGDNTVLYDPPSKYNQIIGLVTAVKKGNQSILFQGSKWSRINSLLAKLGEFEVAAYGLHPVLRFPFRWGIKVIQIIFFSRGF